MKTIIPTEAQKKWLAALLAAGLGISAAVSGVFLTAPSEGYRSIPYRDVGGVLTVCRGHTGPDIIEFKKYSRQECDDLHVKDLIIAQNTVAKLIHVPLNTYQRAALIDFTFNLGETNLRNSTMVKLFNEGKYQEGCNQLVRWNRSNGYILNGLVARRDTELKFCVGDISIFGVE